MAALRAGGCDPVRGHADHAHGCCGISVSHDAPSRCTNITRMRGCRRSWRGSWRAGGSRWCRMPARRWCPTPAIGWCGRRLRRAAGDRGAGAECGGDGADAVRAAAAAVPVPRIPAAAAAARVAAFGRLRAAERAGLSATMILYEAPHRLAETLADLAGGVRDRPAAVARELTKRFEEVRRGSLAELAAVMARPSRAAR